MSQYPYETQTANTYIPDLDDVPVEEPEAAEAIEPDSDENGEEANETSSTVTTGAKPSTTKPNKALIRKIAAKALEVESAPTATRALAAALLGCSEDTVELTAAIMTAGRNAGQPLTDIGEVATALVEEAWEAGIIATSLDSTRQKAVWAVLYAREAVTTPAPPKSLPKAGSAIVKAIHGLDTTDKADLAEAGDLLKRS